MKVQIRNSNGAINNRNIDTVVDLVDLLNVNDYVKVSFDFMDVRLALYNDGTFQIFGGVVNYPHLSEGD